MTDQPYPQTVREGDSALTRIRATLDRRTANSSLATDYDNADIRSVLDNFEVWRRPALDRRTRHDALAARVAELEDEREAWREGAVTRLEQHLSGQKVVLTLAPKNQCVEQLRDGDRCELSAPHRGRLHRVRYGRGYCEWKAIADYDAHAELDQRNADETGHRDGQESAQ